MRSAVASVWAPRLIAVYGLGLIGAGIFAADPAYGFPIGTAADEHAVIVAFTAAVVLGWAWLSCVQLQFLKEVAA
jgi:hypothetical protein